MDYPLITERICLLRFIVVIRRFRLIKLVVTSFPLWPVVGSVQSSITSNDLKSTSYRQPKPTINALPLPSGPKPKQTFSSVYFCISSQPAIVQRLRQNERPQASVKTRACQHAVKVENQFHTSTTLILSGTDF